MGLIVKPVTWTKRALKDLSKVSIFNSISLGKEKALEIAHKVIDASKILENPEYDFQNIGSIDEYIKWRATEGLVGFNQRPFLRKKRWDNVIVYVVVKTQQEILAIVIYVGMVNTNDS